MAAECRVKLICELTGLGQEDTISANFTTTTPTAFTHQYRIQATTNTAEALDLGDIAIVEFVIIKCISNDLGVDCDYVSSFDEDINCQEGETVMFKPSGVVYVQNNDTGELSTYEYWVIGTT